MNAVPGRWRRLAVKLAQHAAWALPGARSQWADAMRRELDHIEDDPAALRWALGCVLASYRAGLAARLRSGAHLSLTADWREVTACGALMLVIGLALQENAGGQTAPPRPFDETTCDLPVAAIQPVRTQDRSRLHRPPGADTGHIVDQSDCADPLPPNTAPFEPRVR